MSLIQNGSATVNRSARQVRIGRWPNVRFGWVADSHRGLIVAAKFCPAEVEDPFDTVQWERRTAAIKDESGGILFEQHDCEVPADWTQLATNVVVSKYFYGEPGTRSVRAVCGN